MFRRSMKIGRSTPLQESYCKDKSNHYWVSDEQLDTKECEKNIYQLVKMHTKMAKDIEDYMCVKVDINCRMSSKF